MFSDNSTSASGSKRSPRYQLTVELPSSRKRSKLATEKTTSLDNLTLGSPADKKPERSSSGLMMSDTIDEVRLQALITILLFLADSQQLEERNEEPAEPTTSRATRTKFSKHEASKEGQPFNIGSYSSVRKESAADLALDADDLADIREAPKPARGGRKPARAASKAKPKGKAAAKGKKAVDSSDDELTLKDEEGEDESFALDSEEEEKQVQKAINASKKPARRPRASTSSAGTSSAGSSTSRAKGGKPVEKGSLLRTAAAKAAERESHLLYLSN